MRIRDLISDDFKTAVKNIVAVVLFFAALLVCLWGVMVVVRFVLG